MKHKVVVITGGTSGIGAACARAFAAQGCAVYTISRHGKNEPDIVSLCADVTDAQATAKQLDFIIGQEGQIDILICCAGFGISGALEFTDSCDAHRQMEVNLFGMDNAIKTALPQMRKQGCGKIIAVSSVAACAAIPFQGWYSVSKAAINTYILALSNEIRDFGIQACAIMPGDIHTGFTQARQKSESGDAIYAGRISRSVAHMEKDERNGMPPEAVADFILRLSRKRHLKPMYSVGIVYKAICILVKLLPAGVVNRIVYALYCK